MNPSEINKLLKLSYIYPSILLAIYVITISINECKLNSLPDYLKIFVSKLNYTNNTPEKKNLKIARKYKLGETNLSVFRISGFFILVTYLLIRYFMSNIQKELKFKNFTCRLKPNIETEINNKFNLNKEKEKELIEKRELCKNRGSKLNTKYDRCKSCIGFVDIKYGEKICELYDNSQNTPIEFNNLDDNCKYYKNDEDEVAEKNTNNYLYDNFSILLLIMFFVSTFIISKQYLKISLFLAILLPIIIVIILGIFIIKEITDDSIKIFNIIIIIIIDIIHLINTGMYYKFFISL